MVTARAALALAPLLVLAGCRGLLPHPPASSRLRVPQEMRRSGAQDAAPAPAPSALRIAEGGRVYEVALPDDGSPVVVKVPLGAGGVETAGLSPEPGAAADAEQQALLAAFARIRDLYGARRFELALIEVSALADRHPQNARLWTMKGSLHKRLGQPAEARIAWERAQKLAPEDPEVAAALSDLSLEEGRR